jgi:YVTN family beta-propeller protein
MIEAPPIRGHSDQIWFGRLCVARPRIARRRFWRDRDRCKPIVASLLAVGLHLLPPQVNDREPSVANNVSVIDTATNTVVGTPVGSGPFDVGIMQSFWETCPTREAFA